MTPAADLLPAAHAAGKRAAICGDAWYTCSLTDQALIAAWQEGWREGRPPNEGEPVRVGPAPPPAVEPEWLAWPALVTDGAGGYYWNTGELAVWNGGDGVWHAAPRQSGAYTRHSGARAAADALRARLPAPIIPEREALLAIHAATEAASEAEIARLRAADARVRAELAGYADGVCGKEQHVNPAPGYREGYAVGAERRDNLRAEFDYAPALRASLLRALNEAPDGHRETLTDEEIVERVASLNASERENLAMVDHKRDLIRERDDEIVDLREQLREAEALARHNALAARTPSPTLLDALELLESAAVGNPALTVIARIVKRECGALPKENADV